ncbi:MULTISPECIES: VOC family protein [Catenuloplanes]|uniref:Enzyme related to lactoylglutathione lyase n=1 Tax=Catenuloplanes niger TaxID=587534 RepID=A0AAE3ZVD5_9ACTN|nr:VOC family protein [Catenuloplanes niger]MDR7325854.1 putative enzyme related to lactoylglutathione lyase [Catenuloplanes niger]
MKKEDLIKATHPMVRFDGLSLDVRDLDAQAAFWHAALGGGTLRQEGPGRARIDRIPQRPDAEILRLRQVPNLSPDGARVHLDLRLAGDTPDALVESGATVLRKPGDDPWFVLADPEGNQFCAYPAVDDRPPGIFELVVKCQVAHDLAKWWGTVLGGRVEQEGEAVSVTGAPEFPWDFMVFDPVPDPRPVRPHMHWHVTLRDETPKELIKHGARLIAGPDADEDGWLLEDPEGNRFHAGTAG